MCKLTCQSVSYHHRVSATLAALGRSPTRFVAAFLSCPHDAKSSPMADELLTIKLYYDYKSPFAYLAMRPAYDLMESHRVRLHYIPHELNVRGAFGGEVEERPEREWRKVRYLYLDARRYTNARGMIIRGPQKIFDSKLSLMFGLFSDKHGLFRPYP